MTEPKEITIIANDLAVAFAAGMAVGRISVDNPERSMAQVERTLRQQVREMGVSSENWMNAYFEFLVALMMPQDTFSVMELEKNISGALAIGVAATQNLDKLPIIGVVPNERDEYGVPKEWVDGDA
jgi:hypothetical protein